MFHILRVWDCRVCGLGTLAGILIRCGVCMRSIIALYDVMRSGFPIRLERAGRKITLNPEVPIWITIYVGVYTGVPLLFFGTSLSLGLQWAPWYVKWEYYEAGKRAI